LLVVVVDDAVVDCGVNVHYRYGVPVVPGQVVAVGQSTTRTMFHSHSSIDFLVQQLGICTVPESLHTVQYVCPKSRSSVSGMV
jgi:hypothetical protein